MRTSNAVVYLNVGSASLQGHPSWIIASWGFESSWYPFDVTRTSCSRLQVPNLLVTDGSIVKTMSRWTVFSPCLPYLFGHLGPRRGPISCVLLPSTWPKACLYSG